MIEKIVHAFLKRHWNGSSPLLLGYSGGPDSRALLYAIGGVPLEVVHVDHGWRQESEKEALLLKEEVEGLGYPFHHTRLHLPATEEAGREGRLSFFQQIAKQRGAQAVLLGHQADDQAETVLKRLFEGAPLWKLGAMKPVSEFGGLFLWRPLLQVSKKELQAYKGGWVDPTNLDPKYLRGKMRKELFPFLKERFGKEVAPPLARIGQWAQELEEFLFSRIQISGEKVDGRGLSRIEKRFVLRLYGIQSYHLENEIVEAWEAEKSGWEAPPFRIESRFLFLNKNSNSKFKHKTKNRVSDISNNTSLTDSSVPQFAENGQEMV
jgi:tRNA(Ile)-lysidine synthase